MKYVKHIKDIWNKLNYILNRTQKRWGIIVLACIMVGALVETLGVSIILPLVQAMVSPEKICEGIPFPSLSRYLRGKSNADIILILAGAVIAVYIFKNLYLIFLSYIRSWYSCKVQKEVAIKMMNSYMKRGYPFFLDMNISKLLRGVGGDVSGLYNVIFQSFKIITEGLTAVCICIFIMVTDFYMALAIAGIGLICVILIVGVFKNKMTRYGKTYRRYIGITNQNSIQAFEGIKEILVMRREKHFKDQFAQSYQVMQKANVIHAVASESPAYIIEGACVAGLIAVVSFKAVTSADIETLIPQMAAYAIAAFRILPSLGRISSGINAMIYSLPSMDAAYENVYEANRFEERRLQDKELLPGNERKLEFHEEIRIQNVSWRYNAEGPLIVDNITFSIKKGSSVAFVGPSGAGKTTLADIILGLLRPQTGDVLVDGNSIFDSPNEWANLIGFVPQSVYLIDDTIRHNVAFGIDEEEIKEEQVWNALEQAQLAEFVRSLPKGLENVVGDKGVRLSGGQRQRIAIAKALYKNPEILVLDEATSALDNDTENAVMEAIELLQGQKTLIIIAHRLSTIQNCDIVYEVKDGEIKIHEKLC